MSQAGDPPWGRKLLLCCQRHMRMCMKAGVRRFQAGVSGDNGAHQASHTRAIVALEGEAAGDLPRLTSRGNAFPLPLFMRPHVLLPLQLAAFAADPACRVSVSLDTLRVLQGETAD